MLLNPKIQKAIHIATHQHRNQKRKINDIPYIVHPFSVAWILSEFTKDEDLFCAAFLHDVIEDTEGYTFENMKKDFGDKVVEIVKNVTEDKNLPWKERKEKYIKNLELASEEVLMLCAADKIHNVSTLREELEEKGLIDWERHFKSFEDTKWYYQSVFSALSKRLKHKILLSEYENELKIFE